MTKQLLFLLISWSFCFNILGLNSFYSPVVQIELNNGELLKGHLYLDYLDGESSFFNLEKPCLDSLKNGDYLFKLSDLNELSNATYLIYTQRVRLPWSYFFIEESLKRIEPSQIKEVKFESEFEPNEFKKLGYWSSIKDKDYQQVQKGIYDYFISSSAISKLLYLKLNEKMSKREFYLYCYVTNTETEIIIQDYTFPFLKSNKKTIDDEAFLNMLTSEKITDTTISRLTNYTEQLEGFIPLINQNLLLNNKGKQKMLYSLNMSLRDINTFRNLLEKHNGQMYNTIPVNSFASNLLVLAKKNKRSNFYERVAYQLLNPEFSKEDIELNADWEAILRSKDILLLRFLDNSIEN